MLLKRIIGITNREEKRTVGLLGTSRGAGVTYTGMLLSSYFGMEKRIKTAFLECNNHRDFERLQNACEWTKEDGKSFSLDRITYYKNVAPNEIAEIFSHDYGCYILDFGTDFNTWKEEFLRCGTKIIIGDRAIWNQSKTAEFIRLLECISGSRKWIYLMPNATRRELARLSGKTERSFFKVPYEPDQTLLSKETVKLFQRLIG